MPMNSYVNPERECRDIGLGYDEAPPSFDEFEDELSAVKTSQAKAQMETSQAMSQLKAQVEMLTAEIHSIKTTGQRGGNVAE